VGRPIGDVLANTGKSIAGRAAAVSFRTVLGRYVAAQLAITRNLRRRQEIAHRQVETQMRRPQRALCGGDVLD